MGAVQGWAIGVIFLLILTAAVNCLLQKRNWHLLQATPLDKPFAVLLGIAACSLFFSVQHYTSVIAIAQLIAYLFFYYIVLHISQERSKLIFLLYWIVGVSTLLCLIGLAQRSGMNLLPWLNDLGLPKSPENWLTATFGNHNHMAGWLEMSIPLLLCLILFGCQREWLLVQMLLLLLQGTCLILTFSRGGWAGAAAAIAFIVSWLLAERSSRHSQIILFSCLAVAVVGILLLASPVVVQRLHEAELAERMQIWRGTLDMIWANWLTGTGPGTYSVAFLAYHPPGFSSRYDLAHNDYLQFTAELGLVLPVLIIWMGMILYRHGLRKLKTSPSRLIKAVTLGSLAGITSILIHSISDFNLHISANALLFSTLAAFTAREMK
jgi:O-antigen ligase